MIYYKTRFITYCTHDELDEFLTEREKEGWTAWWMKENVLSEEKSIATVKFRIKDK